MNWKVWTTGGFALLMAGAASAQGGWPTRQAGLWEIDVEVGTAAPVRVRQCTAPKVDELTFMSIVPSQENCQRKIRKPAKNVWLLSSVCLIHGQKTVGEIRIEGNPKSAYKGTYSVLKPLQTERETGAFQARHIGACEQGMQAGEMVLPNRVKVDTTRLGEQSHDHKHGAGHDHDHKHDTKAGKKPGSGPAHKH